ncbi:hypothetical protein [Kutzneria buriramensis]|uniref:Concanavalin A-like lectin/glucanase superfamily protein n=1 Tax=Kutzneria buriramensis TaxID=1045776 RepID=A0A3E0HEF4_9PSEU|nr:hypothetical protein [Kutzneria buriramensis]REH43651.1 hypothetical protein BCF44_109194 [Kutzneria buriramensis]
MGVLPNPNWPVVSVEVDCTQGPPNLVGASRMSLMAPNRQMVVDEITIKRGRQFELNTMEAGTATVSVIDPLEMINPANTASPFNTGGNTIDSYRCIGIYAYWPLTGNLYNSTVFANYDSSFESQVGSFTAGGGTTLALSTAQAWVGTHSLLVTQGSASSGAWPTVPLDTVPGMVHTIGVQVYLTGTATVQLRVPDQSGATMTSATASTPGVWTRLTVTFTAADCITTLTVAGAVATTPTYYLDGVQYEFGATASAYTASGPRRYRLFSGYVEQWPQDWDKGGQRGIRKIECVDALAILSRTPIVQSYAATVAGDSPLVSIPFDNTASMTTADVGTGMTGAIPVELPNSSNGSLQWGSDTNLDGTKALTLNQRNAATPPAGGGVVTGNQTLFEITNRPISLSTTGATVEIWARNSSGVNNFMGLTEAIDPIAGTVSGSYLDIETNAGKLQFHVVDPASSTNALINISNVTGLVSGYPDGQWHYYALTFYANGTGLALTVDGTEADFGISMGVRQIGYLFAFFTAFTGYGDPQSQVSVSRMAVYTRDISSGNRNNHYQRGIGYAGEISGARVFRLLTANWSAANWQNSGNGYLALANDFSYNGRYMLDVIQEITDTENGQFYATGNGLPTWEDRTARYKSQTPLYVFGEHADSGEIPYVPLTYGFDPNYTYSGATLSRPDSTTPLVYPNPPVVNPPYGQRIVQKTVQCTNDFDLQQAAMFYTTRYGKTKLRVKTLSVTPSALNPVTRPNAWPAVLGAEISQRHTVTRRTSAGVTMTGDHYIESLNHKISAKSLTWQTDFEMSPVFVPRAWVLGDATYGALGSNAIIY